MIQYHFYCEQEPDECNASEVIIIIKYDFNPKNPGTKYRPSCPICDTKMELKLINGEPVK